MSSPSPARGYSSPRVVALYIGYPSADEKTRLDPSLSLHAHSFGLFSLPSHAPLALAHLICPHMCIVPCHCRNSYPPSSQPASLHRACLPGARWRDLKHGLLTSPHLLRPLARPTVAYPHKPPMSPLPVRYLLSSRIHWLDVVASIRGGSRGRHRWLETRIVLSLHSHIASSPAFAPPSASNHPHPTLSSHARFAFVLASINRQ